MSGIVGLGQRALRAFGRRRDPSPLAEAGLHLDHARAKAMADKALSIARSLSSAVAQQRTALDTAMDEARLLAARGHDLRASAERVRESLERSKIVALNAGLEGARLSEPVGKAVVGMAEESRALAARGLEALHELGDSLEYVLRARDRLESYLEQARQHAGAVGDELQRAEAAQAELNGSLVTLGERIGSVTGTDPVAAQLLAAAASHARGLSDTLASLCARGQGGLLLRAVRPTLSPLLRWLEQASRAPGGGA